MENLENTEKKVANSFLADRLAGLVDEYGNPIPHKQTTSEIEEEGVPQKETLQSELSQVELTETTPTQKETKN